MRRPLPITIIGCLFIVAGLVGLVYHLSETPLDHRIVLISIVRIIAIVGGVFLLLGHNWARWLMLAWLGFHVVVSAFHSVSEFMPHVVLLMVVGYILLGPPTSKFFQSAPSEWGNPTGSPKKMGLTPDKFGNDCVSADGLFTNLTFVRPRPEGAGYREKRRTRHEK